MDFDMRPVARAPYLASAYSPPVMKVVTYPLVVNQDFRTPGGGAGTTNVEIVVPEAIKRLMIHCESVRAHVRIRGKSPNFGLITRFYWSIDEAEWSSAIDLHTEIITEGQSITNAYSTAASFGLNTRWALALRAITGTNVEGGILTVILEFVFRT